jgi:hypothetical protein
MEVSAETRLPEEDEVAADHVNPPATTEQENKFQQAIVSWRGMLTAECEGTVAHVVLRY